MLGIRKKPSKKLIELEEIYLSETIKTIGLSLITIFIPIYLYTSGYSVRTVMVFLLLKLYLKVLMMRAAGRLLIRYGPKRVMALSYICMLVYVLLFYGFVHNLYVLIFALMVWALTEALYWLSFNVHFSRIKERRRSGFEISLLYIVIDIAGIIGPALGGLIASEYSPRMIFLVAAAFIAFATVPLFATPTERIQAKLELRKINLRSIGRDLLSAAGYGWHGMTNTILWPLLIFGVLNSYGKVGLAVSLSFLLSLGVTLTVGRLSDGRRRGSLLKFGAILSAMVHFGRFFTNSFAFATGIGVADQTSYAFVRTPWATSFMQHADEGHRIEYIVWMEIAGDIAAGIMLGILIILLGFLPLRSVLSIGFVLSAIGILTMTAMRPVRG